MLFPAKSTLYGRIREILSEDPIVFCEIGARRGGKRFHDIGGFVHYYGFEPDEKEAQELENELNQAGIFQKTRIITSAIMGRAGRVSINVLRHRGCSSVLSPNSGLIAQYALRHKPGGGTTTGWPRLFKIAGTYECDAISLDEFAAREKLSAIDFLQVDTQGTEYEILSGGKDIISESTLLIHVEMETVPLYKNQTLMAEVTQLLSDFGFRLIRLENPQYVSRPPADADDVIDRGELLSVDGVFCRNTDEQFFRRSNPATVVKFMLLLNGLGFKTLAIDVGKRFQVAHGVEGGLGEFTSALEKQYRINNYSAKPLKGKVRERIKRIYRWLRPYSGP